MSLISRRFPLDAAALSLIAKGWRASPLNEAADYYYRYKHYFAGFIACIYKRLFEIYYISREASFRFSGALASLFCRR